MKITFVCSGCGKVLWLQPDVWRKAYEGHDKCLSCRGKERTPDGRQN